MAKIGFDRNFREPPRGAGSRPAQPRSAYTPKGVETLPKIGFDRNFQASRGTDPRPPLAQPTPPNPKKT
jgi:hypothetical protein